ncbi:MAG: CRISPR system precrRNA processing endoribonuclease RAMP protein Cas6 [Anaerolineales bacterium]
MELLSLILPITPLELPSDRSEIPRWWGRAAHAFFLRLVGEQNPQLAQELHDDDAPRPFTVSSLMGSFERDGSLKAGERYWLRLTTLRQDVFQALSNASQPEGKLSAGSQIELDYARFRVEAAEAQNGSPWQGITSYSELGAPFLLASATPPRRIRLLFASPTTFKSEGHHIPLPLPKLVFGSLLEKWNTFAPVAFPVELKRYFEECMAVSRYDLKTQAVALKQGGVRIGMTGWADFTTLNYDRYWMSLVATLARYALFAGVGAAVTQGMGQCRMVEEQEHT